MSGVRRVFSFPDQVDETSARLVAAGVVLQALLFVLLREGWLLVPLVYGFLARVLTGPTLSPLGQLVTRVVSPRWPGRHRQVPGAPKRFAQGIGLAVSSTAAIGWLAGAPVVTFAALAMLLVAASLESGLGICLGCIVHRRLFGCADCDDVSARLRRAPATT